MHDQKKAPIDPAEQARTSAKIEKFRSLHSEVEALRNARVTTEDALRSVAVLMACAPSDYTTYAYRREILTSLLSDGSTEGRTARLQEELAINRAILKEDYKVYPAWLHRRWVLHRLREIEPAAYTVALRGELGACDALLQMDARNFHVWGYRRWVGRELAAVNPSFDAASAEANLAEGHLAKNFSNYSAWHCRALWVKSIFQRLRDGEDVEAAAVQAFEQDEASTLRAFFTDPCDQSAFLYWSTMVEIAKRTAVAKPTAELFARTVCRAIDNVAKEMDTLLVDMNVVPLETTMESVSSEARWPMWMSARMEEAKTNGRSPGEPDVGFDKKNWLYTALAIIDPARKGYYDDCLEAIRR